MLLPIEHCANWCKLGVAGVISDVCYPRSSSVIQIAYTQSATHASGGRLYLLLHAS